MQYVTNSDIKFIYLLVSYMSFFSPTAYFPLQSLLVPS